MKSPTKRSRRETSAKSAARATGVKGEGIQASGGQAKGRAAKAGMSTAAKAGTRTADLPEFCDYECPHAAFSSPDASGACRRDQAIWCELSTRFNNKNARCLAAPGRA